MHPIERLRFVARSTGAPADLLVQEAAIALGAFRGDHAGLVAACRRIVERQLTCAPLWWLCARMLCAGDPHAEAHQVMSELDMDPTARHLSDELPQDATVVALGWPDQMGAAFRRRGDVEVLVVDSDGEAAEVTERLLDVDVDAVEVPARNLAAACRAADLVVVDTLAVGPTATLAPAGAHAAAATARQLGVPVWLVAGAGRLMPGTMFDGFVARWSARTDELAAAEEVVPLDLVDRIAGVGGVLEVPRALAHTDCPVTPELLGPAG